MRRSKSCWLSLFPQLFRHALHKFRLKTEKPQTLPTEQVGFNLQLERPSAELQVRCLLQRQPRLLAHRQRQPLRQLLAQLPRPSRGWFKTLLIELTSQVPQKSAATSVLVHCHAQRSAVPLWPLRPMAMRESLCTRVSWSTERQLGSTALLTTRQQANPSTSRAGFTRQAIAQLILQNLIIAFMKAELQEPKIKCTVYR